MKDRRLSNKTALLLLLIALLPRLFFHEQARHLPMFEYFYLDANSYDTWASEIADGQWTKGRPFHMAPGYPYFLGIQYKLTGSNTAAIRLFQHAVGAVNCLIIYMVALQLLGRGVAWVAFALAVAYAPFVYFEGQLLASYLGLFLGLVALMLLIRALSRNGRGLLIAGLLLGIGTVVRPNLLFFFPLALLWILIVERPPILRSAAFVVAFVLALLPSTVHNYAVSGEFIPISSHGGISFYLGNNDFTSGTYVPPPEFAGNPEAIDIYDSERIAERETGRELSIKEIQSYWYGESFSWIRSDPMAYAKLLGRKILLYLNEYEIPLDYNYEADRKLYRVLRLLPVTAGLLIPLALAGIWIAQRRERRVALITAFAVANAASVIAFFICARYRQTGMPAMIILAAAVLVQLGEWVRAGNWRRFATGAVAVALLAIPVHLDLYPGKATGEARALSIAGRAHAEAGDVGGAEKYYLLALDAYPDHADTRMNLGLLYYRQERFGEARDQFGKVTEIDPRFAGSWNNLGSALREGGDPEAAVRIIKQAVKIDPRFAGAWNNLGFTLAGMDRAEEAESAYRRALKIAPGMVDSWANLAQLLARSGRVDDARAELDRALHENPGHAGLAQLRDALVGSGGSAVD